LTINGNKKIANKIGSKLKGIVKKKDTKKKKENRKKDPKRSNRLFPGSNMRTDILPVK
jgi:hypothetical protein